MTDVLTGDEELARRLRALATGKADQRILGEFGLLAVRFAKDLVRRKTGNLGRTIRVGNIDVAGQSVSVYAGGSNNVAARRCAPNTA